MECQPATHPRAPTGAGAPGAPGVDKAGQDPQIRGGGRPGAENIGLACTRGGQYIQLSRQAGSEKGDLRKMMLLQKWRPGAGADGDEHDGTAALPVADALSVAHRRPVSLLDASSFQPGSHSKRRAPASPENSFVLRCIIMCIRLLFSVIVCMLCVVYLLLFVCYLFCKHSCHCLLFICVSQLSALLIPNPSSCSLSSGTPLNADPQSQRRAARRTSGRTSRRTSRRAALVLDLLALGGRVRDRSETLRPGFPLRAPGASSRRTVSP